MIQPGAMLGPYEIGRVLGVGAAGTVFAVHHRVMGVTRALKVLSRPDAALQVRLLREAEMLSRLRHGNVVGIHDVLFVDEDTPNRRPALVLDLVEGPSLDVFLRQASPAPSDAERIWRGIVAGVAAIHEAGMLHRDVKPANVLLDTTTTPPTPRVTDLGVGKFIVSPKEALTGKGFIGTFGYAAPELFGSAGTVGPQADVFSLGVVGYELFGGIHPFDHPDPFAAVTAMRHGDYPPLSDTISLAVRQAIDRCLRSDPNNRFQDAIHLLRELVEPTVVAATPPSVPPSPRWAGVGVAIAVALAGVAGWQSLSARGAWQDASATRMELLAEQSHAKPSEFVAYSRASLAIRGGSQLPRRAIAKALRRGADSWHFPSPQGSITALDVTETRLVAAHEDGVVTTWDLASGEALATFDSGVTIPTHLRVDSLATQVVIGPDGRLGTINTNAVARSLPDGQPLVSATEPIVSIRAVGDAQFACVTTATGFGDQAQRVYSIPDGRLVADHHFGVERGSDIVPKSRCGHDFWGYSEGGRSHVTLLAGDGTRTVTDSNFVEVTANGHFERLGANVAFHGVDGVHHEFEVGPVDTVGRSGQHDLYVARTRVGATVMHGPSGQSWGVDGLVRWRPSRHAELLFGLRNGSVIPFSGGDMPTLYGLGGMVLYAADSPEGTTAASGLGGDLVVWQSRELLQGEQSRLKVPLGRFSPDGSDVVWGQGHGVYRTDSGGTELLVELPSQVLSVGPGWDDEVGIVGDDRVYAWRPGSLVAHGPSTSHVYRDALPVVADGRVVEPTGQGIRIHQDGAARLLPIPQRDQLRVSREGVVWLAARDGQHLVLSRIDVDTGRQTAFPHDLQDIGGASALLVREDEGVWLGTWSGHLVAWGREPGPVEYLLGPIDGPVNAIATDPDGRVAAGGWGGVVHLFEEDRLLWSTDIEAGVADLAWSPSGRYLAVADDEGAITLLDSNGVVRSVRFGHDEAPRLRWTEPLGPVSLGDEVRIQWSVDVMLRDLADPWVLGAATNLRVCEDNGEVVAVLPFPNADSVWAPLADCAASRVD